MSFETEFSSCFCFAGTGLDHRSASQVAFRFRLHFTVAVFGTFQHYFHFFFVPSAFDETWLDRHHYALVTNVQ